MAKNQITVLWPEAATVLTKYGFKLECIGGISFEGVEKEDVEALIVFMKRRLQNKEKLKQQITELSDTR